MKQDKIYKVLRKVKSDPSFKRKIKIILTLVVVSFFIIGALVIWAGVSTFNAVASKTNEVFHSPSTQAQIENLKSEVNRLPRLQLLSCWGKAQSLLAVQPWLERPALENLISLKVACLEPAPTVCQGADCQNLEKPIKSNEWETI